MKKIKTTTDQWQIDENGFVISRQNFFHIRDVQHLVKSDDGHTLSIGMRLTGINIAFSNKNAAKALKDRDGVELWLRKCMIEHYEATKKHADMSHAMHKAALEIQNRIAGKFINHDH